MTSAAPPAAEDLVRRLLATEDADRRRALIDRARLSPEDLRDAVLRLVDEANRVLGADPRRTERISLDARALAARSEDEYARAMALMCYGDACRYQGRNAEAQDCYDRAADVFKRLGRPVEAARTRIGWVAVTAALGHPDEALAAARAARRVLIAHGESVRVAGIDMNIGILHGQHGRFREAVRAFTSALRFYESAGQATEVLAARCRANRGRVLTSMGRYRDALADLESARATFQRIGEDAGAARLRASIGELHMELGDYAAALRNLERARDAFVALDLPAVAGGVALAATDCYLRLNRPADALATLELGERGLDQASEHRPGLAARRAAAHLLLGQYDLALETVEAAERRAPTGADQHHAWLAAQRAAILHRDGAFVEARAAAQQARIRARAAGMRRLVADTLVTEGLAALALGQVHEAERAAERARRLAARLDAAPLLHRAHELLGRVAEAQRRPAGARHHYVKAIRQLEREQRGVIFEFRDSFAASRVAAYERLAALQAEVGDATAALTTAERAKSRALADAVAGAIELRPRGSALVRGLTRELAATREAYAATVARAARQDGDRDQPHDRRLDHDQLGALERQIADLVRRLQIGGAAEQTDLLGGTPVITLPDPPAGGAIVEFFFCGEDILRFVLDAAGVRCDRLPTAVTEVERLLRYFRVNLDAAERAEPGHRVRLAQSARNVLHRIYQHLLGDLDGLSVYRSLVVVPHGLLHYLPFHALHDGERYLVERFEIVYAPSATLYGICRDRTTVKRGRPLVLAHSAGGRLPSTIDEAASVGAVLGVPVHTEAGATRSLLEREGPRAGLIHIAAHGRFRPDAPLFSGIELADGPLTAVDIFSLDLPAELITLSACETGRAVLGGGDELVGLARAFLCAGAGALLVSQWRVDDVSTAALMQHFYEVLGRGLGPAAALREAQIARIQAGDALNDAGHPFNWAGFQIIGADRAIKRRSAGPRKKGTAA